MARINISEFQFSFAFFHKFMLLEENQGKSFAVPSLSEEGGRGGAGNLAGLDLKVGEEYFIQFKMSDRLTTLGAREIRNENLDREFRPYFRFNIKNSDDSNQFNTLVNLAKQEGSDKVFYVAPLFEYPDNRTTDNQAFNDFWNATPIDAIAKTCFIDFHQFVAGNPLLAENNDSHVVCYNIDSVNAGYAYLLSEPIQIKVSSIINTDKTINNISLIRRIQELAKTFDSIEGQILIRDWKLSKILDENVNKEPLQILSIIQRELIARFNIFWIPQIISKKDEY